MEEAKYSFNVPLPKNSTYDTATMLTIRADHSEELKNSIDAVFGVGTYDRVTALALVTIQSLPTGGPTTAAPAGSHNSGAPSGASDVNTGQPVVTVPASGGSTVGASGVQYPPKQTYGACPECGEGQIVDKFRTAAKGGGFMGRGCDAYNRNGCNYMAFWANR